jgi:hypothetical protein
MQAAQHESTKSYRTKHDPEKRATRSDHLIEREREGNATKEGGDLRDV